ncbi:MAG: hypothetical protein OXN17_18990 [Candidatus Poribacteria bacterium]|nr:hypothetical protein [Candidatus Poribacteria bacterium]MDE0505862.1 hypothetical protein [Candidatus Poribacteria bacterium]
MKYLSLLALPLICLLLLSGRARAELQADWEQLVGGEFTPNGTTLETDQTRLFLGEGDGFYMSRDHGYTWRLTLPDRQITAIAIGKNALYAGTSKHGLFRSDSRGVTWQKKSGRAPIKQIVVLRSGAVIAGRYPAGVYISFNRGDTWDDIYDRWLEKLSHVGYNIWSITEFDGYLWSSTSGGGIIRTPDMGKTWKWATEDFRLGRVSDWAVFNDRLYAAAGGFGRWNEAKHTWEYFNEGLQPERGAQRFSSLAVNRGRLYARLLSSGVYLFDERSETFVLAGLRESVILDLVSHQGYLYAAAEDEGIYRASIPAVQPYNRATVTWGALKTK